MLLAADIGNSLITLGVHDGTAWRARWQIRSDPERPSDEYGLLLEGLLGRSGLADKVARLALASAVPALVGAFRELGEGWLRVPVLVVGPGVRTGLTLRVDHPSEVGPDLVADAVAAYARFGDRAVAVDFGTATALVAVAPPGALVGVTIAPGLRAGAEGLALLAAQLPHVPLAPPPRPWGRTRSTRCKPGSSSGTPASCPGSSSGSKRNSARRGSWPPGGGPPSSPPSARRSRPSTPT